MGNVGVSERRSPVDKSDLPPRPDTTAAEIPGLMSPHSQRLIAQIVSDGSSSDTRLPHRVADLVQPIHHVTRRVQAAYTRPLMSIDGHASFRRQCGAEAPGQFRPNDGTQRRIDRSKAETSAWCIYDQKIVRDFKRGYRPRFEFDTDLLQLSDLRPIETMLILTRDDGHVSCVASQENSLLERSRSDPDHAYSFIRNLVAIANRTVAQKSTPTASS